MFSKIKNTYKIMTMKICFSMILLSAGMKLGNKKKKKNVQKLLNFSK